MHNVGPPDPEGYYVLVFRSSVKNRITRLDYAKRVIVEEQGDIVVVRTKSRSIAKKLLRMFRKYSVS